MTKNKSGLLPLFVAAILIGGRTQAQESINVSGGDAAGTGGTVAYSIGQINYTTNSGATGSAAQGVQQTYQIFTVGVKETALDFLLSVFPNPTAENLNLLISNYNNEKLQYQIYDMQGKLLNSDKITSAQTIIEMRNLPAATYFINVIQENKEIQTYKIIKN